MRKILFLTLLLVSAVQGFAQAPNTWVQKADFAGVGRSGAVGFSIGSKGYIGTGEAASGPLKDDFWEYDPATNTWAQKANFAGGGREEAVGFSIGTKGYIGTGHAGSNVIKNDFWEYDPVSNTWKQKANFYGGARESAVGFCIGAKGYVGTGYVGNGISKRDFWEYDPVYDVWIPKANFGGVARYQAVGFSIGTLGYIGTGYDYSTRRNDFWEYDPVNDTWLSRANLPGTPISNAVGFSIGQKGYIGTGGFADSFGNPVTRKAFWEYNQSTNSWSQRADVGLYEKSGAVGFSIGQKGYIGTGAGGLSILKDFWEYNPDYISQTDPVSTTPFCAGSSLAVSFNVSAPANAGNIFTAQLSNEYGSFNLPVAIGTLNSTTSGSINATIPSTTANGNGYRIRVVSSNPVASILLDNGTDITVGSPGSANSWSRKANFPGETRGSAVAFSIGSKGYIGTGNGALFKDDFWEYDPVTNTWSQKANFAGGTRYMAVGFSIGSKGYIGTGSNVSGKKNDFWEYDPITNAWTQKANFPGGARYDAVGFSIGSKGYVGTGRTSAGTLTSDFWEYNPATNTWTSKANLSGGDRAAAVGFSIGSKGYIGGGNYGATSDFWEYDPAINIWFMKSIPASSSYFDLAGFSIGSKGYICSYRVASSGSKVGEFWEYNPVTSSWTQKTTFGGGARESAIGFSIGSKGYIGTGTNMNTFLNTNDFWEYSPTETPDILILNGSASICANSSAQLSINSLVTGATYQWSLNGNPISGAIGSNYTATVAGNYTVKVIGACFTATSAPTTVTINPVPVIPTVNASGSTTFCSGSTLVLTATSTTSNATYTWFKNGVLIPGATAATLTVNASGNYSTVASLGQCSSSPSSAVAVTVNNTPTPAIVGLNTSYCQSAAPVTLNGTPAGSTFKIDGVAATVFDPAILSLGTHTVEITNTSGGCTGTASQQVTVLFAPTVPVVSASGPTSFCYGNAVVLSAVSTSGASYQWFQNGTALNGATTATYIASVSGNYTVKAVLGSCSSVVSASTTVTAQGVPGTPFIYQSGNTLTSNTLNGNQWYLNGNLIPGATNQTYTATVNGNYTVVITANGCSSAPSNAVNVNINGLREGLNKAHIQVSPNPNKGVFSLRTSSSHKNLRFDLFDLSGKLITKGKMSAGKEEEQINVKGIAPGTYLLKVTADTGGKVFRILVE